MATQRKYQVEIEGETVAITNPDKVMFPSGFTKGQVIDYYVRVSEYLLPHLRDRPVTLKRYPDGTQAPHFYEKDAPRFTPNWVQRFAIPRRSGQSDIHYVLINNLPSLVWSANVAKLEVHPFLARAPEIDRPLCIVFDLDPGEGAEVLTCAEVAFLLKDALAERWLECFAKVSGSKGMQVYVPLNSPVTYARTQPFARQLAEELERQHPELVVSAMAKTVRARKVFIDWSQNSDFKTTVAVYSLRAKRERPYISMPFTWEELRRAMKKKDAAALYLEPEAALKRLQNVGDLFAPVLEFKQSLPSSTDRPKRTAPRTGSHATPTPAVNFVEPMRAKLSVVLPEGPEWLHEIFLPI